MRFDCAMQFNVEGDDTVLDGFARSLSGGGLRFESPTALEAGTVLDVVVRPPLKVTRPLHALVEVIRCDESGGEKHPFLVAASFQKMLAVLD